MGAGNELRGAAAEDAAAADALLAGHAAAVEQGLSGALTAVSAAAASAKQDCTSGVPLSSGHSALRARLPCGRPICPVQNGHELGKNLLLTLAETQLSGHSFSTCGLEALALTHMGYLLRCGSSSCALGTFQLEDDIKKSKTPQRWFGKGC